MRPGPGGGGVIEGRTGQQSPGIGLDEGSAHLGGAQGHAIHGETHCLAEGLGPVQVAHRPAAGVGLAPAVGGQVHQHRIGQRPRAEGHPVSGARPRGAAHGLHEGRRGLQIGQVAAPGDHLHVPVVPAQQAVLHLVQIGQLPPGGVHLPVVGIAPQDQDVVGPVGGHHPGAHGREVHPAGGEGQLVVLIAVGRIVAGVLRPQHMGGAGTELPVGHLVEIVPGKGLLEGPADPVGSQRLERGAVAEAVGIGAVQRADIGIQHIVPPVEHHVVAGEGLAVRPLRPLHQLHGQLPPVPGPGPRPRQIGQGLERLAILEKQGPGAGQALHGADVDPAPALGLTGAVVPPLGPSAGHLPQHVPIDPRAIGHGGGSEHQRLPRQALGDGRQQTPGHIVPRHPVRLGIGGQGLEPDQVGALRPTGAVRLAEHGWGRRGGGGRGRRRLGVAAAEQTPDRQQHHKGPAAHRPAAARPRRPQRP